MDQLESAIINSNKFLKTTMVESLVEKLDSLDYISLDTEDFERIFHEFGINIRYVGLVAQKTKLPHI